MQAKFELKKLQMKNNQDYCMKLLQVQGQGHGVNVGDGSHGLRQPGNFDFPDTFQTPGASSSGQSLGMSSLSFMMGASDGFDFSGFEDI